PRKRVIASSVDLLTHSSMPRLTAELLNASVALELQFGAVDFASIERRRVDERINRARIAPTEEHRIIGRHLQKQEPLLRAGFGIGLNAVVIPAHPVRPIIIERSPP